MAIAIALILAIATVLTIEGLAVMLLWNYLAPEIIPTSDMSFWQAIALVVLTSLLFGNIAKPDTTKVSKKKSDQ